MRRGQKTIGFMLLFAGFFLLLCLILQPITVYTFRNELAVLFPKGSIALEQRNLLFIIQAIMLLVIFPVYILTFIFSWMYRAHNNPKAKYDPDLVDNHFAECVWWGIPLILTLIVGAITWIKTYELDPYKPLVSDKKAVTIQVVALQWKWLFIYPEEKIAVVNFMQIPKDTPIHFEITSDAPMNSFWIPHLGGQIYAMPAMQTELYLIANETGDFRGCSANISGEGFSGMHFIARASSEEEYQQWLSTAKQSTNMLDLETYNQLAAPSKDNAVETYQLKKENLFHHTMMKYMEP